MADAVSHLLEHRRDQIGRGALARALVVALGLHLVATTALVWLPRWIRKPAEPPRYVAVQVVSAEKLGIEKPKPAPPRPEPVKPVPEPKVEAPVLPDKKAPPEKPKPAPETAPAKNPEPEPPETRGSPTGAATGLDVGASVAAFDNPDFTYGYYVDQMLAKISSNWSRPPVGSGVEATLYFRIQRDGRITDLSIARSSGINGFDLAALRAVQASSPLPPLPRAFHEDSLGVNLIVR
jgi:periplasmic protein TonB